MPPPNRPADFELPRHVLDAWTALEVLSPQSFRRPEELVSGDRRKLAALTPGPLPWAGEGERPTAGFHLFYQVILGTIDLEQAYGRLLGRYSDRRPERPRARGEAIAAACTLDRDGRLVDSPAAVVSSFGWALPRALAGDLLTLARWPDEEGALAAGLEAQLRRRDDNGAELPLDPRALQAAWSWLVAKLGLPAELVQGPRLALRTYESTKSAAPPDPLLLGSFYLDDLAAAKKLFVERRPPAALAAYLGQRPPGERVALLEDDAALAAAVAPPLFPPARWPGAGRFPLTLLQQAAVNLGLAELKAAPLFAINGPPGTGKTTLLRDFVAALVAARAEAMAELDDPAAAFLVTGEKMRAGAAWLQLFKLDPRLRGYEMVVASSNNRAVENVSEALPAAGALDESLGLSYFRGLAEALLGRPAWGLAAAVMGNGANRNRFRRTFWWDPDVGFSAYLAEAAGMPQLAEFKNADGSVTARPPRIIAEEKPPRGPIEAKARWQEARRKFRDALAAARQRLTRLEEARREILQLPMLSQAMSAATAAWATAKAAETVANENAAAASAELELAKSDGGRLETALAELDRARPGFLARLFKSAAARAFEAARAPLAAARLAAAQKQGELTVALLAAEGEARDAGVRASRAGADCTRAAERWERVDGIAAGLRREIGAGLIDQDFFGREPAARLAAAPWLDREAQAARDAVFAAAFGLHRAFLDAAAKPLRHNLGALMNVLQGARLKSAEQQALLPDLWSSLFLVVPLVSTTFASVERMLGDLPPESLGWLFVDEAGQAAPQQAVGALMRARRAVVVGDPVQIEPVVTLPTSLTQAICGRFGVDADRFDPPGASAQTLADAATRVYAEFPGRFGSRQVGMPLLLHRRCAEPMFGIANAVAYDRRMVQATPPRPSPIGAVLGPSALFDVAGGGTGDKWSPAEGAAALGLLRRLAEAGVAPDLCLVSPFAVVVDQLRRLVAEAGFAAGWLGDPGNWVYENVGTVHTVQGREAEAVILVLGAPGADQAGARYWAGGAPNLLNVAVTRAKERLYVIGDRAAWREAGLFRELDLRLP